MYQHRVSPFSLEKIQPDDASSCRAYRKILVFFLVDPTSSILSTANVPPQDRTWFTKQIVREAGEEGKSGQYDDEKLGLFTKNRSYFQLLEYNVLDQIMDKLKFPISASVAKHVREELMEERKLIVDSNNKELFEREFSLCEH